MKKDEADYSLTPEELNSTTWAKILKLCELRTTTLRYINDNKQSEIDTAMIRGGIREIKDLVAKASAKQPGKHKINDATFYL